jgi:hypothetical protein
MTSAEYKTIFIKKFYEPTYTQWRIEKKKAAKDIVGENYENFRKNIHILLGGIILNPKKIYKSAYNADLVVKYGSSIIIEESKASYVDSCFLERTLGNFCDVIVSCKEQKIAIPKFIISSSTRMANYQSSIFAKTKKYKEDITNELINNLNYFPLANHSRVSKNNYFADKNNCFKLSDENINAEIAFLKNLK